MIKMYLPNVPPTIGDNVIIPSKVWTELIYYIDSMRDCINTQADTIGKLSKEVDTANSRIKILAKGLEDVYNENA